ncbi:hypothetical protein DBV15_00004 [Temnothorax longispinosus]|uniref:Uncharacterized protein n=1 Tax=Temnothorax longispinosus TaxID=300112 RepID=A0A4S2KHZ9_9HYME|nr:hypothetical protein DBV15_00004 [Temnothorax longispinosus]
MHDFDYNSRRAKDVEFRNIPNTARVQLSAPYAGSRDLLPVNDIFHAREESQSLKKLERTSLFTTHTSSAKSRAVNRARSTARRQVNYLPPGCSSG